MITINNSISRQIHFPWIYFSEQLIATHEHAIIYWILMTIWINMIYYFRILNQMYFRKNDVQIQKFLRISNKNHNKSQQI
jgi:NADH:ubiquinone oxidoreductase subunit 2 (subunit N)